MKDVDGNGKQKMMLSLANNTEEVIITEQEEILSRALSKELVVKTGCIWCFKCNSYFTWYRGRLPDYCQLCKQKVEYGEIARPDILASPPFPGIKAVIRVQGGIHYKNRKKIMYDRFQLKKFIEANVLVFDVTNEEVEFMADHSWLLIAFSNMVGCCLADPEYYSDTYLKDREVSARMLGK